MSYQFSNPVSIGNLSPRLGASLSGDWPSRMTPLKYKYSGLGRNLGPRYKFTGFGTVPTTTDSAAATAGVQSLLNRLSGPGSFQTALGQASGYINLVLGAASIGTGVASAACSGCDRTGIDITNNIIGWIRALLSGQSPTVRGLTPAQLQGFVDFCRIKDAIKGGLDLAFSIASLAATRDPSASNALLSIQGFLGNFLDSICLIPAVQALQAAQDAPPPPDAPPPTMQTCSDGTVIPADQACPPPRLRFIPNLITQPITLNLQERCADGSTAPWGHCPAPGSGGGGGSREPAAGMSPVMMVGIALALGVGVYAYNNR